jgi:hypothetical protein
MVVANAAVGRLLDGVDPALLNPPVNVIRLSLDPRGLAPRIVNLHEWRSHLLDRLRRQYRLTRDVTIDALLHELEGHEYATGGSTAAAREQDMANVLIPLRLATAAGVLSFFSTTTVFGTPAEITLSELSLEAFYPADANTAAILGRSAQRIP